MINCVFYFKRVFSSSFYLLLTLIYEGYKTYNEIVSEIQNGNLDGCLVDSYVAEIQPELRQLERKTKFTETERKYGIVFNDTAVDLVKYNLFKKFVENNKDIVTDVISKNINGFPVSLIFI